MLAMTYATGVLLRRCGPAFGLTALVGCGSAVDAQQQQDGTSGAPGSSSSGNSADSGGSSADSGSSAATGSTTDGDETTTTGKLQRKYCLERGEDARAVVGNELADIDGSDGLELWAINAWNRIGEPNRINGYRVDGLSIEPQSYSVERLGDRFAFHFADIDGDGRDDLVQTWDGRTVFYPGQSGLSLADDGQELPSTLLPLKADFVDFDEDGDADLFMFSPESGGALEIWRNDLGSFANVGEIELGDTSEASLTVRHVPGSRWVAVSVNNPARFLVLNLEDGLEVLRQTEETVGLAGGYVDEDGPAVVITTRRNRIPTAIRLRWNADALEELEFLQLAIGGVVGEIDGEPMFLSEQYGNALMLTSLSTEESWVLVDEGPSPWQVEGTSLTGRVFMRRCSLLDCSATVARVVEC